MSNNQDLIQTLEKSIAESQKNIRVLNAVKDVDNFIVISIAGNTITSSTSDGMKVSNAVAALSAAIRSYSENLYNPEDLNAIISIIDGELSSITQRAEQLQAQEQTYAEAAAYEHEEEEEEVDLAPMDAPSAPAKAVRPTAKGVLRK